MVRRRAIQHGSQLQVYPTWPTTYYGPETGVGLAVTHHPARSRTDEQFRIGVVGLGAGTMAAYANARISLVDDDEAMVVPHLGGEPDYLRFYELNPLVTRWAAEWFTYWGDARARGADVDVFEGDARIVLERQLDEGDAQGFHVLAVDAFSSDAIPIHLLTRESVGVYLQHLARTASWPSTSPTASWTCSRWCAAWPRNTTCGRSTWRTTAATPGT